MGWRGNPFKWVRDNFCDELVFGQRGGVSGHFEEGDARLAGAAFVVFQQLLV